MLRPLAHFFETESREWYVLKAPLTCRYDPCTLIEPPLLAVETGPCCWHLASHGGHSLYLIVFCDWTRPDEAGEVLFSLLCLRQTFGSDGPWTLDGIVLLFLTSFTV